MRKVTITLAVIVLVLTGGVAVSLGVAMAATPVSVSQTIESSQPVSPGENVTVSATIEVDGTGDGPAIEVGLPTSNWTLTPVENDSGTYKPSAAQWVWLSGNHTVTFRVTVPSNAANGTYNITTDGSAYNATQGVQRTDRTRSTIAVGTTPPPTATSTPEPTPTPEPSTPAATETPTDDGGAAAASGDGGGAAGAGGASATVSPSRPNVSVVTGSVPSRQPEVGEAVGMSAALTNTGGASGDFLAELRIDGRVVDGRNTTVPPNANRTITFTHTFDSAGTYRVQVGNVSIGTVSVASDPTATAAPGPTTEPVDSEAPTTTPQASTAVPTRTTAPSTGAPEPTTPSPTVREAGGLRSGPLLGAMLVIVLLAGGFVLYRRR